MSTGALNHLSLLMDGRVEPSLLSGMLSEALHLEKRGGPDRRVHRH